MNIEEKILSLFEENEKRRELLEWFNTDEQNQELLKLYNSKNEVIKEIEELNKELKCGKLALLLPSVPQNYQKSKYKIMAIGQELYGGYGVRSEPRITMLDNLRGQSFDSCGRGFFSFPAKLCHAVNEIGGKLNRKEIRSYFVWAEIRKFSYWKPVKKPIVYKKPSSRLNNKVQNLIDTKFNILEDEIRIINPDIVLFLTGPNYDDYIRTQLDGVKFYELENSGYKKRQFARVEHPVLEGRKAFRVYHPGYLNRIKRKTELGKKCMAELLIECKK